MSSMVESLDAAIRGIDNLVVEQQSRIKQKESYERSIAEYNKKLMKISEEINVLGGALELLQGISDDSIKSSYEFMEESINSALKQIFPDKVRTIKINESPRGTYPQLRMELLVENKEKRSLKLCTGHGVLQVISLLSNMCLITITGKRRFILLDEVVSGMSANTLSVIEEILYAFSEIGFQYLIIEHGYIPKGSMVYVLVNENGVGRIKRKFIEKNGVYLDGKKSKEDWEDLVDKIVDGEYGEEIESNIA